MIYDANEGRMAELSEILAATVRVDLCKEGDEVAAGVPIISDGRLMMVDNQDNHSLIVGASGSGKTWRVNLPLIDSISKAGNSMLVHDPKGELFSNTKEMLEEGGYKIVVLNFKDPMLGDCYNPLSYPAKLYHDGGHAKAKQYFWDLAHTIYYTAAHSEKDVFWENSAQAFFTGLCVLLCELLPPEQITMDNLYKLFNEGTRRSGQSTYLKQYYRLMGKQKPASYSLISPTEETAVETRTSIYGVTGNPLIQFICNDELVDMMSVSNWEVEMIGKEKTAVFLITESQSEFSKNIVSAIVQQIYQRLIDYADAHGGRLDRRCEFVLDEFGTMAAFQDAQQKLSDSRSRNIRFHLSVQSLEQLSHLYGDTQAQIIMGNCTNWFYLFSSDLSLLKMISERAGYRRTRYTNELGPVISVDALAHLNKEEGEMLYIGRTYPFITYLPMFCTYANYKQVFSANDIMPREKHRQELFSFTELVEKMDRMETMSETIEIKDPFFCISYDDIMTARRNPEKIPGYLLFATEDDYIFCNRIGDNRGFEVFCTFKYNTNDVVAFYSDPVPVEGKKDSLTFAYYQPRMKYSALHELSKEEGERVLEEVLEVCHNKLKEMGIIEEDDQVS